MNSDYYFDVLGLGSVTVDLIGTLKSWPGEGMKQPLQSMSIHDGGLVGTALTAVARLGGRACFAGKLGHSDMAHRAIETFEKDGVNTSYIIRAENTEPIIAFVFTNSISGERNIFWTNQNVQYPFPPELPENWYNNIRVLLVDHESGFAGIEAAKIAIAHNIPVVVDIEQNKPYVPELMTVSSHIVVSENFAAAYTKKTTIPEIITSLRTSLHQTIIITQGQKGCSGIANNEFFEIPAFKVKVVDTTGCGDVFHGAYALAIARGKTVINAAKFACAAAALCATKLGGRDGIPTQNELEIFIKENK